MLITDILVGLIGDPVRIFMNSGDEFTGIVLDVSDDNVRLITEGGKLIALLLQFVSSVQEPQPVL